MVERIMAISTALDTLTDRALLDRFALAVHEDREHTRLLLELIDAIDQRKLWAKQGHSSLFALCVERFHMSESTAAKRIGAARTARRFPLLLKMVARGEIHLSGIHRLKAYLSEDNHRAVLARAKHRTIKQIESLVRELAPQPDVPSTLRRLPERRLPDPKPGSVGPARCNAAPRLPERPRRAPDPAPLSPARYKLQVTLDEESHQTLKQLQDLLAHQIPSGDPAAVVKRALATLLADTLKKKAALTESPRDHQRSSGRRANTVPGRHIPAPVKREVWQRDRGRCRFVGADGSRCNETRALEFAHLRPWGKGGEHSAENLALRCRAHNALEADRDYGERFMQQKRERSSNGSFRVRERVAPPCYGRTTFWASSGLAPVATWPPGASPTLALRPSDARGRAMSLP